MSTKLYHGWQLHTDVFAFTALLRAKLRPVHEDLHNDVIVRTATHRVDAALLAGEKTGRMAIIDAWADWSSTCTKRDEQGMALDPFFFEACFGVDWRTGVGYALLYDRDVSAYRSAWADLPVSEFAYWDNADHPSDCTAQQWQERKEIWTRVLPDLGAPAEEMLTFRLAQPGPSARLFSDLSAVAARHLPSLEVRANAQARRQLLIESADQLADLARQLPNDQRVARETWVRSHLEHKAAELRPHLAEDILPYLIGDHDE